MPLPAEPPVAAALAVLVAGVAALLAAERAGRTGLVLASKGAASAAFVALGWLAAAPAPILAGLVLSLAGDLLLVPRDRRAFRAGIVAFLLAHVAYAAAFARMGVAPSRVGVALVVLAPLGLLVARWLWPRVPRPLRGPVAAYVVVITGMVALAAGTGHARLALAAALFWGSDVLVARDRFVRASFANRLAGLPAYYGAQAVFALSA